MLDDTKILLVLYKTISKYTNLLIGLILIDILLEQSNIVDMVAIIEVDSVGVVSEGSLQLYSEVSFRS